MSLPSVNFDDSTINKIYSKIQKQYNDVWTIVAKSQQTLDDQISILDKKVTRTLSSTNEQKKWGMFRSTMDNTSENLKTIRSFTENEGRKYLKTFSLAEGFLENEDSELCIQECEKVISHFQKVIETTEKFIKMISDIYKSISVKNRIVKYIVEYFNFSFDVFEINATIQAKQDLSAVVDRILNAQSVFHQLKTTLIQLRKSAFGCDVKSKEEKDLCLQRIVQLMKTYDVTRSKTISSLVSECAIANGIVMNINVSVFGTITKITEELNSTTAQINNDTLTQKVIENIGQDSYRSSAVRFKDSIQSISEQTLTVQQEIAEMYEKFKIQQQKLENANNTIQHSIEQERKNMSKNVGRIETMTRTENVKMSPDSDFIHRWMELNAANEDVQSLVKSNNIFMTYDTSQSYFGPVQSKCVMPSKERPETPTRLSDVLSPSQELISWMVHPYSNYPGFFVFQDVGTGKTRCAIRSILHYMDQWVTNQIHPLRCCASILIPKQNNMSGWLKDWVTVFSVWKMLWPASFNISYSIKAASANPGTGMVIEISSSNTQSNSFLVCITVFSYSDPLGRVEKRIEGQLRQLCFTTPVVTQVKVMANGDQKESMTDNRYTRIIAVTKYGLNIVDEAHNVVDPRHIMFSGQSKVCLQKFECLQKCMELSQDDKDDDDDDDDDDDYKESSDDGYGDGDDGEDDDYYESKKKSSKTKVSSAMLMPAKNLIMTATPLIDSSHPSLLVNFLSLFVPSISKMHQLSEMKFDAEVHPMNSKISTQSNNPWDEQNSRNDRLCLDYFNDNDPEENARRRQEFAQKIIYRCSTYNLKFENGRFPYLYYPFNAEKNQYEIFLKIYKFPNDKIENKLFEKMVSSNQTVSMKRFLERNFKDDDSIARRLLDSNTGTNRLSEVDSMRMRDFGFTACHRIYVESNSNDGLSCCRGRFPVNSRFQSQCRGKCHLFDQPIMDAKLAARFQSISNSKMCALIREISVNKKEKHFVYQHSENYNDFASKFIKLISHLTETRKVRIISTTSMLNPDHPFSLVNMIETVKQKVLNELKDILESKNKEIIERMTPGDVDEKIKQYLVEYWIAKHKRQLIQHSAIMISTKPTASASAKAMQHSPDDSDNNPFFEQFSMPENPKSIMSFKSKSDNSFESVLSQFQLCKNLDKSEWLWDQSFARSIMIDIFNHSFNQFSVMSSSEMKRYPIFAFIGDKQTKEGISFYGIKHIHILQPQVSNSIIQQIVGRGLRNDSMCKAEMYDVSQWGINVWFYVQFDLSAIHSRNLLKDSVKDNRDPGAVQYASPINRSKVNNDDLDLDMMDETERARSRRIFKRQQPISSSSDDDQKCLNLSDWITSMLEMGSVDCHIMEMNRTPFGKELKINPQNTKCFILSDPNFPKLQSSLIKYRNQKETTIVRNVKQKANEQQINVCVEKNGQKLLSIPRTLPGDAKFISECMKNGRIINIKSKFVFGFLHFVWIRLIESVLENKGYDVDLISWLHLDEEDSEDSESSTRYRKSSRESPLIRKKPASGNKSEAAKRKIEDENRSIEQTIQNIVNQPMIDNDDDETSLYDSEGNAIANTENKNQDRNWIIPRVPNLDRAMSVKNDPRLRRSVSILLDKKNTPARYRIFPLLNQPDAQDDQEDDDQDDISSKKNNTLLYASQFVNRTIVSFLEKNKLRDNSGWKTFTQNILNNESVLSKVLEVYFKHPVKKIHTEFVVLPHQIPSYALFSFIEFLFDGEDRFNDFMYKLGIYSAVKDKIKLFSPEFLASIVFVFELFETLSVEMLEQMLQLLRNLFLVAKPFVSASNWKQWTSQYQTVIVPYFNEVAQGEKSSIESITTMLLQMLHKIFQQYNQANQIIQGTQSFSKKMSREIEKDIEMDSIASTLETGSNNGDSKLNSPQTPRSRSRIGKSGEANRGKSNSRFPKSNHRPASPSSASRSRSHSPASRSRSHSPASRSRSHYHSSYPSPKRTGSAHSSASARSRQQKGNNNVSKPAGGSWLDLSKWTSFFSSFAIDRVNKAIIKKNEYDKSFFLIS